MDQAVIDKIEPEITTILATASSMTAVPDGTMVPSELVVYTGQMFVEAVTNTLDALIGTSETAKLVVNSLAKLAEAENIAAKLADEIHGEGNWEWDD